MIDIEVIEYRMVTSRGETISILEDRVNIIKDDGITIKLSDDDPRKESNILLGIKGAGASFGVITGIDG